MTDFRFHDSWGIPAKPAKLPNSTLPLEGLKFDNDNKELESLIEKLIDKLLIKKLKEIINAV